MSRLRRNHVPGAVYHVIARFIGPRYRLRTDGDRREYLARLARILAKTDWRLIAFAIMGSHVHLVLVAGELSSGDVMRRLHTSIAMWLNRRDGRRGPVFADRHRAIRIEGADCARAVAYVHNNPVRAGVVDRAGRSTWTSHRYYVGVAPCPDWLDVRLGLSLCGFADDARGRERFAALVDSLAGEPRDARWSHEHADGIRAAVRATHGGSFNVSESTVGRHGERFRIVAPASVRPAHPWSGSVDSFLARVAEWRAVDVGALRGRSRRRDLADARRLAVVAWTEVLDRAAIELAAALGLSSSAVSSLRHSATHPLRREAAALGAVVRARRPAIPRCSTTTDVSAAMRRRPPRARGRRQVPIPRRAPR